MGTTIEVILEWTDIYLTITIINVSQHTEVVTDSMGCGEAVVKRFSASQNSPT